MCRAAAAKRPLLAAAALALVVAALPTFAVAADAESGTGDSESSARTDPTQGSADGSEETDGLGALEVSDILLVTGGAEAVETLPGSGHFLGRVELERQGHSDIHRVLQQVEGVNVQEEDGFGLRPNIGMRGTGVNRSEKITLLEDGVLIAPAPYTAPAAYYFPTSERMEAVEVRKGSSAITQGPYTTGGVLNLVSTSIPASFSANAKAAAGSHDTIRAHGTVGESHQRFGWLLEGYHHENDGFKDLDGGGSTGVELEDLVGKARWNTGPEARLHQSLELKLGRTTQTGHETYLGLSQRDFDRSPFRRYAASRQDLFDGDHEQVQLRHLANIGARVFAVTTAYRNSFSRNWHKLQSVGGSSLARVLDQPELYRREHALLRGDVDGLGGPLRTRNNRRDYLSEGFETRVTVVTDSARSAHEIEAGLRFHRDEEDRFQEEDLWDMVDGRMRLFASGDPGSQSNRISSARAFAFYVSDTVRIGDWTLTPGARIEQIDFETLDFGKSNPLRRPAPRSQKTTATSVFLPGIGVSYRLGPSWNLLLGVHRGFSAPGPGQDPETDAEESLNYEFGFNYQASRERISLRSRIVAFVSDYDNLIGRDSLSTGGEGTNQTFNGGKALVRGLEAAVESDLGPLVSDTVSIPLRLGYTFTQAEFGNGFETRFSDWAPRVSDGDRMPYLPEHQASLSIGAVHSRWSTFATVTYAGEMRTRPGRGPITRSELIGDHVLVDLTARADLGRGLGASLQVRNLLDHLYVASRRPAGLRPGLPQTLLIGLTWEG